MIVGAATAEVAFGEVPEEIAADFGDTMAGIGIPILMAAVIGKAMMESGAAERIVRSFRSKTGEDRSYLALWGSSSALSIPVFFDNVFYLMAPLALITTAGIMAPQVPDLAVHPVYLALIIGAGGNICSWFNDSGFWLVKEIGGLTQAETVKIWTALTTIISITAFVVIVVAATIVPLA